MDLKTCRWMTRLLYVGCLALMVAMVRDKFWRCPKCGKMLPKGGKVRCQSCGWEML